MSNLSGRVTQSPTEIKRKTLDYTEQLADGEAVTSIACTVTQTSSPVVAPNVTVTNIVIGPGGLQVIFYISGGVDGNSYELDFLAGTSLNQSFEDVVEVDIAVKS